MAEGRVKSKGRNSAEIVSPEVAAMIEKAFPLGIDLTTPKGKWAAEQIEKGVRPLDVIVALQNGAHPPGAPREDS